MRAGVNEGNLMRRVRVNGGLLLAALAIAITAAACFPTVPPPPPTCSAPTATPQGTQLSISPTAVDYGCHALGGLMANMPKITVTVTNHTAASVPLTVQLPGGIYSTPTDNCTGATLTAGGNCMVVLQYCPNTTGTTPGMFVVTGTGGLSASVNVMGTAT